MKFFKIFFKVLSLSWLLSINFSFGEEIQVKPGENEILIQFSDSNKVRSIYLDGKPMWQGSSPTYRLDGLDSGTPYTISIRNEDFTTQTTFYVDTVANKDAEIELKSINASESPPLDDFSNKFRDSSLNVYVFEDRIELDIGFVPSDSGVLEVYRNGVKIGETSNHYYIDHDIEKEMSYDYEVHGSKALSEVELEKIQEKLTQEGIIITEEVLESIASREYILGKVGIQTNLYIEEADNEISPLEASFASSTPIFYVNYNTFIPWRRLYVPLSKFFPWEKDYYAEGDDRSFLPSPPSKDYRTTVLATVTFSPQNIKSTCDVGITRHYDMKGNLIYTGQALMDGIKIDNKIVHKPGIVWWRYIHAAKEPSKSYAPAIDWSYEASVWRNGKWQIYITHDRSPAHDVYISRHGKKGWKLIHKHSPHGNPMEFIKGLLPWPAGYRSIEYKGSGTI